MKLPSEFEAKNPGMDGRRNLSRVGSGFADGASCQYSCQSYEVEWGSCRRTGTLGICRGLFIATAHFYIRSVVSCWLLLCARSIFHVCGQVLRTYITGPVVMLDLCAAPGGKSTHARSVLPVGSLLVANEVMRNRSQVLAENLIKWGNAEVVVTNNDPADFTSLTEVFDVVLADVPCSGEGMFRKDPVAVEEWSTDNVRGLLATSA